MLNYDDVKNLVIDEMTYKNSEDANRFYQALQENNLLEKSMLILGEILFEKRIKLNLENKVILKKKLISLSKREIIELIIIMINYNMDCLQKSLSLKPLKEERFLREIKKVHLDNKCVYEGHLLNKVYYNDTLIGFYENKCLLNVQEEPDFFALRSILNKKCIISEEKKNKVIESCLEYNNRYIYVLNHPLVIENPKEKIKK